MSEYDQYRAPPPRKLTVETTSICNLRCVMCPQAIGVVRGPKHLPEILAEKLRPVILSATYSELHGIGEPLLSPSFWRLLELFKQNPTCEVVVNSNLIVLTEKMLESIATSRLFKINISLDAATAETYRKIRGANFETVTKNISRLSDRLRKLEAGRRPRLVMNMTVMKENLQEVPQFVQLAKSLGADEAIVWPINDYGPDDSLMKSWETNIRGWKFVYREQVLTDIAELAASTIASAASIAKQIGMEFTAGNLTSELKKI
jgi:MoaA/NifB/PqqE/SkfB family radical SAM enzyme